MNRQKIPSLIFFYSLCLVFIVSCNNGTGINDRKIVEDPEKMDKATSKSIQQSISFALENKGKLDDSIHLKMIDLVSGFYKKNEYGSIWSHDEKWIPLADTLLEFIKNAELYGLFPKDYHLKNIRSLKAKLDGDSIKRMDAVLWTKADLMLSDAFLHLMKDLKVGRLTDDSTYLTKKDKRTTNDFYISSLKTLVENNHFSELINSAEPKHSGYVELKKVIPWFLDSMDRTVYTYLKYPHKANDEKDSLFFIKTLQKRLRESSCIEQGSGLPDSTELNAAIKKYQKKKGVKQDGKVSASIVRLLNLSDVERFKSIAITLDRYKQLPAQMPEKYIWVNLPAYYLKLWDNDTVALESKIICGKPATPTPLLYSVISDMITYPTWTVPNSIISKQYLPKLKSNPNYLTRIGLRLVNGKGETVNGSDVNWSKYSKGIPFNVVQASGDGNALGIMKFNFSNPFSVYLHDTNQRYLFQNASRALSHGCVRVQQWKELAFYISRNDSMNLKKGDSLKFNTDSINNWLAAKVKKRIPVKNGVPLFITYFCCEAKGGKIKFYDDIYGEYKILREKCFSDK